MNRFLALGALTLGLAACSTAPASKPETASSKAAPVKWSADPYPST